MVNIHGVSTGRISKSKGSGGRAKSAFQGSGRRMNGSVIRDRKKAVDMSEDYSPDNDVSVEEEGPYPEEAEVVKEGSKTLDEDTEIVDESGNFEIARRMNSEVAAARFGKGFPHAEVENVECKKTIFPCTNGIFTRFDPSNRKRLRAMSEAELLRKGQNSPCTCDTCKPLMANLAAEKKIVAKDKKAKEKKAAEERIALAKKEAALKKKADLEKLAAMENSAGKSTRSGKSFNTQGRMIGD